MAPLLLAGFTILISCSKSTDDLPPATADTSTHKISIMASQFDPARLDMLQGTSITWTNNDSVAHSVVSNDGTSFNSGTLNPGQTYHLQFLAGGAFQYHCGIHPSVEGVIYVINKQ